MGKRGPKRSPTNIKRLRGNPGKRALPANEPEFDAEDVVCPSHLSETAKREWERIAPSLRMNGLLTKGDQMSLAVYCSAVADYIEADEKLQQYGSVVKQGPQIIPSPYVNIKNKAAQLLMRTGKEFGFTPSARADLGMTGKNTGKDEFTAYLERTERWTAK
jgi:P27 family predicted phage terminase small subunit